MRRAAKVDANQAELVRSLRERHHWVLSLAGVGNGVTDLLVYSRVFKKYYLVEIKDGSKPPSQQKLTPQQVAFHRTCPESYVVNSADQLINLLEKDGG